MLSQVRKSLRLYVYRNVMWPMVFRSACPEMWKRLAKELEQDRVVTITLSFLEDSVCHRVLH